MIRTRILALLLAAVMGAGLTACSDESTQSTADTAAAAEADDSLEIPEAVGRLRKEDEILLNGELKNGVYVNRYFGPKSGENVRIYHVLGSGNNLGTANFGTMKLLESCGFSSVPCDLEEWAHSHYFAGDKNTHVIVLGAKGRSHFRAQRRRPSRTQRTSTAFRSG